MKFFTVKDRKITEAITSADAMFEFYQEWRAADRVSISEDGQTLKMTTAGLTSIRRLRKPAKFKKLSR